MREFNDENDKTRVIFGLLLLMFSLAAGCAVGPNFVPPRTEVPETWNAQEVVGAAQESKTVTDPAVLAGWWRSFQDATLTSLVETALETNLDLRQAQARIRQARAARGIAGAGFWPQVDAQAFFERSSSSSATVTSSGVPVVATGPAFRDLFQVGLDASWELDIFGGTRRSVEAATADLQAAVEDRHGVLVTLAGEVGTNYLSLRGLQQQLAIARQNLAAQEKTARIIRQRYEAGFASRLDLENAQAQVNTTAAQIPLLESQARVAIYSLGVLLGQPPGTLASVLLRPHPIPTTPPQIPVGLPSDLVRRRPDIRRAEAQLHAATARLGVAVADLFPRFFLTGSAGFAARDISLLGSDKSRFWSFGPSIRWPIFAGGRIRWNIELQDAVQEQALLAYQQTVLTALKDVETALVAYAKEQEHRQSLIQAVENNRKAVELAMQLYLAGRSDFLNVLTAQRSLFVTEEALAQSTRDLTVNLVALYKALGGGWEQPPKGS
ncbi:MAG: efflux transporter outer membrane subunit [Desulfobacca sp.]|uniref:efflux transporter outer membrane subunit n=1 Tax=Desulfobacca sp. TaxID=2067990 RepID=UPI00404A40F6